jgi:WD40 repeat protein
MHPPQNTLNWIAALWMFAAIVRPVGPLSICCADDAESSEAIAIAELSLDAPVDFTTQILPFLQAKCLACHNASDAESDLVLETPETVLRGGSTGPAAVAGKPADSLVLQVAAHQSEPFMPPPDNDVGAKNLTPQELGLLKIWIEQGAAGGTAPQQPTIQPIVWKPLPSTMQPILAAAVTYDGRVAACGRANRLFLYDLNGVLPVQELIDPQLVQTQAGAPPAAHLDLVQSLAWNPAGDRLASGGFRTVKLWRKKPAMVLAEVAAGKDIRAIAVSPDGSVVAMGHASGAVGWWNASSGQPIRSADVHQGPITDILFSADGTETYTASEDRTARSTRTADGTAVSAILTPAPITAMIVAGEPPHWITGHSDAMIRVWAPPTTVVTDKPGTVVREIQGHGRAVTALSPIAASPQQFLSGSVDGTLRRWDVGSGAGLQTVIHADAVTDVAASPDGTRFVSAGADGAARLWNAADGKLVAVLQGDFRREQAVHAASLQVELLQNELNHFRQTAEAAGKDAEAKQQSLAKASTEKETAEKARAEKDQLVAQRTNEKEAAAKAAAEAAEGLAKATEAKTAAEALVQQLTSAVTKLEPQLQQLNETAAAVKEQVDLTSALAALQSALAEAKAKQQQLQEALAGTLTESLASAQERSKTLAATAEAAAKSLEEATKAAKESQTLAEQTVRAAEDAAGEVRRADEALQSVQNRVAQLERQHQAAQAVRTESETAWTGSRRPLTSVAFSHSGKTLAIGSAGGQVLLFDGVLGRPTDVLDAHAGDIAGIGFLPHDAVASAGGDGRAVVHGTTTEWTLERTIGRVDDSSSLADRVLALAFSPDGRILATGGGEPSRSGQLKLWNVDDGTLLREISDAHSDTIFSLAFSRDGKHLASAGADRMARVFRVEDGAAIKTFEGHTHHVLGVSWSANGRWLATSGADNVVKIWNFESGEQLRTIEGFQKEVTAVDFLGIREQTVAASGDAAVRLHNTADGKQIRALDGAGGFLYTAATSGDGQVVAAGGLDSVLTVWKSETGEVLHSFSAP